MEPTDFSPRSGWTTTATDSGTLFTDVDLEEKEWCDYDEKEVLAGLELSPLKLGENSLSLSSDF